MAVVGTRPGDSSLQEAMDRVCRTCPVPFRPKGKCNALCCPAVAPKHPWEVDDRILIGGGDDNKGPVIRIEGAGNDCNRIAGNNHCIRSVAELCGITVVPEEGHPRQPLLDRLHYTRFRMAAKQTDRKAKVHDKGSESEEEEEEDSSSDDEDNSSDDVFKSSDDDNDDEEEEEEEEEEEGGEDGANKDEKDGDGAEQPKFKKMRRAW